MSLPSGYSALLNELNKAVLREEPQDLIQFCANYFNKQLELDRTHRTESYTFGTSNQVEHNQIEQDPTSPTAAFNTTSARVNVNEGDHPSDSDSDVEDPRDTQGGISTTYNLGRRTSVSAESLDPTALQSSLPKTIIPKTPSQRTRIEHSISQNLLFRNLDEAQHIDVINAMKEISVQPGIEVIVQGAVGDFFYVVESGTFEVWVRPAPTHTYIGPGQPTRTTQAVAKKVAGYGPGGSFGELALMYNAPRAATVVATSSATMWALDRVTFRSILMEHTSRKRKMYENFLAEVEILTSLTIQERSKIADALEEKVYEEGENVVVEGEVGKNFYIVESGTAQVFKRSEGNRVLKEYTKGGYFGELALLNAAPRAATVRAAPGFGRLRVATLGEKAFTRLLGPVIDILERQARDNYGKVNSAAPIVRGGAREGEKRSIVA